MRNRYITLLALFTMLFMAGCSGCGSGGGSGSSSTDTPTETGEGAQTGLPTTTVRMITNEQTLSVNADVANTNESRRIGLMYVYYMPDDKGMLFVFDTESYQSFWMKNTYIQLDMLFINAAGEIVDINKNAQPLSLTSYQSTGLAKYVLEVNGGWCDNNGVSVGDTLVIDGY